VLYFGATHPHPVGMFISPSLLRRRQEDGTLHVGIIPHFLPKPNVGSSILLAVFPHVVENPIIFEICHLEMAA
jgi:hypothetical protein